MEDPEDANHGEVFTKPWVVNLILDLAGYVPDVDLGSRVAIEPACGSGAFLVPMVRRLSSSCRFIGRDLASTSDAIYATDVQIANVQASKAAVQAALVEEGWSEKVGGLLADSWIHHDDFLLGQDLTDSADYVLGNPPYVRLEDVPTERRAAYQRACPTMGGRADLYVGFFEIGLRALRDNGRLAFICADRWMRNSYGRHLRSLVASDFAVETIVTMHDVDAFEEPVAAYPAVTVLSRKRQEGVIRADTNVSFGAKDAQVLGSWVARRRSTTKTTRAFSAAELPSWFSGEASWPDGSPGQLLLLADLEARFPSIEETGAQVGIGIATGADSIFVTTDSELVEDDRLQPLAMVRDTTSGHYEWSGHYLVNPWGLDRGLVDLDQFPKMRDYFAESAELIRRRHIARKRPQHWYRTIDGFNPSLVAKPKLLLPDMKVTMAPVLEPGGHYPHHNLYYVISDSWPLETLGGLLLSRVAEFFIRSYAVKMRGGTLRFQAQYLRRIRVPALESLCDSTRIELGNAFEERDVEKATGLALRAYGLDPGAEELFV